jgi:anti-sigma28 factor (negative regulator of flagellin synthesis)
MKINPVPQNDTISKYLSTKDKTASKTSVEANIEDKVELSEGAQKYAALIKTARDSADSSITDDDAKIADIKSKITNNTYNISDDQVARSIINGVPSEDKE